MGRRSRAGQVALVIVLTVRRDEVQRTSGVRFDTRQCAEVCQTWARNRHVGNRLAVRQHRSYDRQGLADLGNRRDDHTTTYGEFVGQYVLDAV